MTGDRVKCLSKFDADFEAFPDGSHEQKQSKFFQALLKCSPFSTAVMQDVAYLVTGPVAQEEDWIINKLTKYGHLMFEG